MWVCNKDNPLKKVQFTSHFEVAAWLWILLPASMSLKHIEPIPRKQDEMKAAIQSVGSTLELSRPSMPKTHDFKFERRQVTLLALKLNTKGNLLLGPRYSVERLVAALAGRVVTSGHKN